MAYNKERMTSPWRFLSRYWREERGKIALVFGAVMVSQGFSLLEPYLWTRLLDDFLRQVGDTLRFPTEGEYFGQVTVIVTGTVPA